MKWYVYFFVIIGSFAVVAFANADELGNTRDFFIDEQFEFFGNTTVSATLRVTSERAYFYVSDEYFSSLGIQQSNFLNKLSALAEEFDKNIYPIETEFWGNIPSPGIDNNDRITVLLAWLADEAGGYFDTGNQFSRERIPLSNEREMIYLNADSIFSGKAKIFLAHEFQHLITFNEKELGHGITEDIWLNEVRSEYTSTLLGYDEPFEGSNLFRRAVAFLQEPSDPLGEWKNTASDYGVITLFGHYFMERFGREVLSETARTDARGIAAVEEALKAAGAADSFSDVFTAWTIASLVNDTGIGREYGYRNEHLSELTVSPTERYGGAAHLLVQISKEVKDWEPGWYEFSTGSGAIRLTFTAPSDSAFRVPVVVFLSDGSADVRELVVRDGTGSAIVGNFGDTVSRIVAIPSNQKKIKDFTDDDPSVAFTLKAERIAEADSAETPPPVFAREAGVTELRDGDLVRVRDSGDLYVVRETWIRYLSSDDILDFYGHLSSEVPVPAGQELFIRYAVSNYIREVNDEKIYAVWPDGTKHWMNMTGRYFKESGRDFNAVYIVNKKELDFYETGVDITR